MTAWRPLAVVVLVMAACTGEQAPPGIGEDGTAAPTTAAEASLPADDRAEDRSDMVDQQIAGRGVSDPAVLEAMLAVPRHRFVDEGWQDQAYDDHPLPIGHGQTISQPYIVAVMSEALGVEPGAKVLEIGTGSGYQAAVLAEMGIEVYSIEIISELAERAAATLGELGYGATTRAADGYFGWAEEAPFDAIIVTAAPDHVPQPLVDQLAPGAVMVIPVGPIGAVQTLWRFTKAADGEVLAESLGPVSFVPFTRADG
jgi:protein-L-isoaspartate(D-aspartate) O-methyltransferase